MSPQEIYLAVERDNRMARRRLLRRVGWLAASVLFGVMLCGGLICWDVSWPVALLSGEWLIVILTCGD